VSRRDIELWHEVNQRIIGLSGVVEMFARRVRRADRLELAKEMIEHSDHLAARTELQTAELVELARRQAAGHKVNYDTALEHGKDDMATRARYGVSAWGKSSGYYAQVPGVRRPRAVWSARRVHLSRSSAIRSRWSALASRRSAIRSRSSEMRSR
jgi:hypothetical protein